MNTERRLMDVVVAVGTDHHPFDRLVGWVDRWAAAHPDTRVLIQRGSSVAPANCESSELLAHGELCELFAMAAVVVSHGGPSTVMDARMAGRKPIVVARDPSHGEHVDDHQMRFADHLDLHEVALVVDDEADLHQALDEALADPGRFAISADHAAAAGVVEFARRVDGLLGTITPLIPVSPAGFPDRGAGADTGDLGHVGDQDEGSIEESIVGSTEEERVGR